MQRKSHLLFIFVLSFVLSFIFSCSSGGGGGTPVTSSSSSSGSIAVEPSTFAVSLTSENDFYELIEAHKAFIVRAEFEQRVTSIDKGSLSVTNASVDFLSPIDEVTYTFSVTPDGSGGNIAVSIPSGRVLGLDDAYNTESNSLTIAGRDTIPPTAEMSYTVLSYHSDHSVNEVQVDELHYQLTLISLKGGPDISLNIAEQSIVDLSDNANITNMTVGLSAQSVAPNQPATLELKQGLDHFLFS